MQMNSACRLCSDIGSFLFNSPAIRTLIKFKTSEERESYCTRILQRINVKVSDYSILNLHRIGVDAPPQFIYNELLQWDGTSTFWPNQLARVNRVKGSLENILIYFLGLKKLNIPWFRPIEINLSPLFNMNAIHFQDVPPVTELDGARYLLYKCSGGYPIGIFCLYIRRRISGLNEIENVQLFSLVAFNFYGKKNWFFNNVVHFIWETIHNRASANILNRMKVSFEKKFEEQLKSGAVHAS
jgi:hypothetical protein